MNKLNNVEAQRVMTILTETIDRIQLLSRLPEQPDVQLFDTLREGGHENLADELRVQYKLEEALRVMQGGSLRSNNRYNNNCIETRKRLHAHSRALCRVISHSTNALHEAATDTFPASNTPNDESKEETMDGASLRQCIEGLTSLKEVTLRALGTTVEEESSMFHLMQEKAARAKETDEDRTTLQNQLNVQRFEKEKALAELDLTVTRLQVELSDIKQVTGSANAQLEQDTENREKEAKANHETNMQALNNELAELEKKIAEKMEEAEATEAVLRKKKTKADGELRTVMGMYDRKMTERNNELELLEALYKKEKATLEELELHFDKKDEELAVLAEEERVWKEKMADEWEQERIEHEGATALQKCFRGMVGRKEFQAKFSKKKKGKKKKK